MTEENQEKKIIVDEDWKSQVEAEKEALKAKEDAAEEQKAAADDTPNSTPEAAPEAAPDVAPDAADDMEMPPASFSFLVTTFATQVLSALGQMPDPVEGKPVVRLGLARHFVDMLAVLEEKTKGNLSPEEEQMLSGTIHHLRMAFVSVQNESQTKSDG